MYHGEPGAQNLYMLKADLEKAIAKMEEKLGS